MPSEPLLPSEPTLEELSAYLDHELDDIAKARVAEHVAGCADCQARLDGLRQTAYAIRALPLETPPRTFTIPARWRESFQWAPALGWIGGVAAAMLIIVIGVMHVPFLPAGMSSNAPKSVSGGLAQAPTTLSHKGAGAAPVASSQAFDASRAYVGNFTTVSDPRDSSRTLTLSTTASAYSLTGVMTVRGQVAGFAPDSQPRLLLERNGYAVELATPTHGTSTVPSSFEISYDLSRLPLPSPAAGSYTLTLIWSLPEPASGSRSTLVARLPITIQG
jgi:anti-sigma factor RsiW